MYEKVKPILFMFDAETIHGAVVKATRVATKIPGVSKALQRKYRVVDDRLRVEALGCEFENPTGLAAGFDKHAEFFRPAYALGFGHEEVGGFTRYGQDGNERPRLFRLEEDEGLINRFGFNNMGSVDAAYWIRRRRVENLPVIANIAKSEITPLDEAPEDYVESFKAISPHVDAVTINVSCPNSEGATSLQGKERLIDIVQAVQEHNSDKKPIQLKVTVDLSFRELYDVIAIAMENNCGITDTNTSKRRSGLRSHNKFQKGGYSGPLLREPVEEATKFIYRESGGELLIIGVGGIRTAEHAMKRVECGATLLQGLTGLIYEGPSYARDINVGLLELMDERGYRHISEAVGRLAA